MQLPERTFAVSSAQGKRLRLDGITIVYKVFGQDTGNLFSAIEHITDPKILVPPHMHSREDQFMYVLEGELVVRLGERVFEAKPGAFVTKPRNVPHALWNIGETPARHLEIVSPPGFERFFEDLAKNQEKPQSERTSVSPKYGMTNVDSWIQEIVSRYKVRLNGA